MSIGDPRAKSGPPTSVVWSFDHPLEYTEIAKKVMFL